MKLNQEEENFLNYIQVNFRPQNIKYEDSKITINSKFNSHSKYNMIGDLLEVFDIQGAVHINNDYLNNSLKRTTGIIKKGESYALSGKSNCYFNPLATGKNKKIEDQFLFEYGNNKYVVTITKEFNKN